MKQYFDNGLSIVPIRKGTKAAAVKWQEYMVARMSHEEFITHKCSDLAIIGGKVSGYLECLDFDNHFNDAEAIFAEYMSNGEVNEIVGKYDLPIQTTPSGGFHVIYRAKNCEGAKKLARRLNDSAKPEALIETRGEGSYFLATPSEGYLMFSGALEIDVPTITNDERNVLIEAAKQQNEYFPQVNIQSNASGHFEGTSAGDDFNEKCTDAEAFSILRGAGWSSTNGVHWTRPNKKRGVSATYGKVAPKMFYVFSSNAHPFDDQQGYYPFAIKAMLEYNGDYQNCTKDLGKAGYGTNFTDLKKSLAREVKDYASKSMRLAPAEMEVLAKELKAPIAVVKSMVSDLEKEATVKKRKSSDDDGGNKQKSKREKMQELDVYFEENCKFRRNSVTSIYEMLIEDGEWEDFNEDKVYNAAIDNYVSLSKSDVVSRVMAYHVEDYDPFINYFSELAPWDGSDRISKLTSCIIAASDDDQEYVESMIKKALVRQYLCATTPFTNREVIIFISESQGNGKTSFCRWITPVARVGWNGASALSSGYSTETNISDHKDTRIATAQNFTFIIDEIDKMPKQSIGVVKSLISSDSVNERFPYEKQSRLASRKCSFWATSNEDAFLSRDANTRWIPLYIDTIKWEDYINLDRDQLWAQIKNEFDNKKSASYKLSEAEVVRHRAVNEDVIIDDDEVAYVERFFVKSNTKLSNIVIRAKLIEASGTDIKFSQQKLTKAFRTLGFKPYRSSNERGFYCSLNQKVTPF